MPATTHRLSHLASFLLVRMSLEAYRSAFEYGPALVLEPEAKRALFELRVSRRFAYVRWPRLAGDLGDEALQPCQRVTADPLDGLVSWAGVVSEPVGDRQAGRAQAFPAVVTAVPQLPIVDFHAHLRRHDLAKRVRE